MTPRRLLSLLPVAAVTSAVLAPSAAASPACPISYGLHDDAKPNRLFLYFPTVADSTFPEFTEGSTPTSPAEPFDAADLTSYGGTTDALRDAIHDVVTDDYCEFNVQVRQTATAPTAADGARRNVVAVGTDPADAFGQADLVDIGDATDVDFARVWGGTYQSEHGAAELGGASSTLARWARALGGTVAHEAGHSYGLQHTDDETTAPGEDALTRHIMPRGPLLDGEHRAGYRRHFSDRTASLLASNVGLSIQTMHNWDLVNPNAATARRLRMEFLAPDPTAILSWAYTGARSPWSTPTVTGSLGTTTFRGATYHRFAIEWTTPQAWSGGAAGQVPGGAAFHIGSTFSGVDFDEPDAIIIRDIELQDAGGTPLALQPRLPGYDAGTLDAADGTLDVAFFNQGGRGRPFELRNVIVRELPRVLSINAMLPGTDELFDPFGERFSPWRGSTRVALRRSKLVRRGQALPVEVSRLTRGRHILERVRQGCNRSDNLTGRPDTRGCMPGINIDLFPATTVYLTATVVDPAARHWDPRTERYVVGPLASRVFLQVAGRHPDLNRNRRDDTIDIVTGRSRDHNQDGVPDEVQ